MGSTSMRSPWTTGGLQKEGTATMTTDRKHMAMVATVIDTKWSFLVGGKIVGGAQTDVLGPRVDDTGLSTTRAGLPHDTGAEIAAGTNAAITVLKYISL